MSLRILVALSNHVFSEGVKRILEDSGHGWRAEMLSPGVTSAGALSPPRPDVVLVDFTTLYNVFGDLDPEHDTKLILIDTACGEDNIISAVVTKGLKGVLACASTPELLIRAVKAVAGGEVWLDKANVKNLLSGLQALKKGEITQLSLREWDVVRLVGQGFRNKEIADKLSISESTVKTHLQRIFQKLDIQNRPQLITFAIRNKNGSGALPGVFLQ